MPDKEDLFKRRRVEFGINFPSSRSASNVSNKGITSVSNRGRRVGRNPTPGVPRKVGPRETPINREEMVKKTFNPRRKALMKRIAAKRKKD